QVPGAGGAVRLGDAGPGGAVEYRGPVVRRLLAVLPAALREDIEVPLRGVRAALDRAAEQLVLVGGVVGDDVDDHAKAELVGAGDERVRVGEGAEAGVHIRVVGDVVAAVLLRGGVEGREPDRVDAQVAQVGETLGDAGEIAHAVAVRIGEGAGVDLVHHGVAPPLGGAVGRGGAGEGGVMQGHGGPSDG